MRSAKGARQSELSRRLLPGNRQLPQDADFSGENRVFSIGEAIFKSSTRGGETEYKGSLQISTAERRARTKKSLARS